ncbi:glycosyl hydrolase-like protein [Dinothrombium tinctorium]|uniref:glucosylceramidase n=1 Tax=Dinothrombium tinctorium TaxID=1965070 RepID=A0A443QBL9_9ACAR|nr:glycosyl hydrolase-like protein [Dinothrombium tinctorium]
MWIMQRAKEKYGVNRFIASAWSPPYSWKTSKGERTGKNMNSLAKEHYQDYADYLANFVDYYNKQGIDIYALSPQNEPEFPTTSWDGCFWWPDQLSEFVKNYLKQTFNNRKLNVKIMVGENANWDLASWYLSAMSSELDDNDFDIYASHGYSLPISFQYVTYNKHITSWPMENTDEKEKWITEASATDNFDASMKKGVELAVSLSNFLAEGNVSGFVFWLAMINGKSNEALIGSDGIGNLTFPKVYYVYGQFTKHLKQKWVRIDASMSILTQKETIHAIAFKDPQSRKFAIIIMNEGGEDERCVLEFENFSNLNRNITLYLTNENFNWKIIPRLLGENDSLNITIPRLSVLTVTGFAS